MVHSTFTPKSDVFSVVSALLLCLCADVNAKPNVLMLMLNNSAFTRTVCVFLQRVGHKELFIKYSMRLQVGHFSCALA